MKNILLTTVLLSALVLGAWSFTDPGYDSSNYIKKEEMIREDLSGIDTVRVENVNGGIVTSLAAGNNMELKVTEKVKIKSGHDADEIINEIQVVAERRGSELHVYIDYGRFKNSREKNYYSSSYELSLPARLSVELNSVNGAISAPAFEGKVSLTTVNGSIKSAGAGNGAKLSTTNGGIRISNAVGSVRASSTNGSIDISGAAEMVEASTTNGDINIYLDESLAGDITAESVNGSIKLELPTGSSYSVKAETFHGKVYGPESLDYNKRRNYATGSVGGGQFELMLETMNGSIRIK